jgi:flavin-dependent dehydrogenase
MPAQTDADVLVIGGGPSGSTVSTLLAQRGYGVTLFERERFPRDHVGESLLPYCYGVFDELGVLEAMKERMVRKPGVRFIDVDGRHHTTWCFGHVIKDESHLSFHVRRDRFDDMLLRNAEAHGVDVHEETRVRTVALDGPDGLVSVGVTGPDGEERTVTGQYVIDASGRDTFIATRMGWKRAHDELDRVATSAHWEGVRFNGGLDEGLLQIVYLGGEKKGWIWVIPIGADRVSIGVVVDNSYFKDRRSRLRANGSDDTTLDYYLAELGSSAFVAEVIRSGSVVQGPMVNGNYSYKSDTKYGPNFALVGDAHSFIDPIFASGIYLSMNSARLVARALDEALTSRVDGKAALDAAYEQIAGAYRTVEKAIRLFYNPTAINFAQAGSAGELIHERHKNAMASMHYLLAGDFFGRHEEYSRVIDLLADPKLFARYKSFVVDRPELSTASTCGMDRAQVFSEMLLREAAAEG